MDLRSWERAADLAWFSSVASCTGLDDEDFNYARRFFKRQGEYAYTVALEAVGGPSYLERSDYELFPIDEPEVLSDSDFFKREPQLRLQKQLLDLANYVAHEKFVNYVQHADTSEQILVESMKRPNVSILSRMFTANLMQPDVRVTKPEFTSVARQFVCLPPLLNGSSGEVIKYKCGCEAQKCVNPKCHATNELLDSAGNHGLICNPAMRATLLERSLEVSFRAGGNPVRQPSTYSLLGKIFSKDDLSKLFPGKINQTESNKRKLLAMEYLDIINEIPRGHMRTAKIGMLRERFPDAAISDENDNNNGIIRFDLKFPAPACGNKPREVWLDHAIVKKLVLRTRLTR